MRPELRFVLAIFLMIGVLFGTNLLFPPEPPPEPATVEGNPQPAEPVESTAPEAEASRVTIEATPEASEVPERRILVRGPLYEFEFSNYGAQLESAILPGFRSFADNGPVQLLLRDGPGALGSRVVVTGDTLDFSVVPFEVTLRKDLRWSREAVPGSSPSRSRAPTGGRDSKSDTASTPTRI